ncbi:MAG: hypothetical protein H5U26_11405 [Immundisolibacter sp.]|uniref:DUF6631 family protein n=1 Tax=Immundisolibacter sp. TaxID=1934948 RepID=UPI001982F378|nr:DUF6631 family protein [Immundisolibacter sp.]MBC7162695.1 hypothetical protein [Immundisolibacter sp.]
MARKLGNGAVQSTAGQPARRQPAPALAVLHPEREARIADRVVQVREYGYVEGLKLQAACKEFLDALYGLFSAALDPPSTDDLAELIGTHIVTVQWLIAQALTPLDDDPQAFAAAVEQNARWVGRLSERDGDTLTTVWWETNTGFFTRRLQRRLQARLAAERAASQSASSASTTA